MLEKDTQVTKTVFNQSGCGYESVAVIKLFEEASKWVGENPTIEIEAMSYSFEWIDETCEEWICYLTIYHRLAE